MLKYPFPWEERRPALHEGVLFIPDYYFEHHLWSFPGFAEIFGKEAPVHVEYCSGNGAWILEKAKNSPDLWVAVEWRFDRVRKIWSKMRNLGLKNLLIVCGDARIFAQEYLPSDSVNDVYINFPDPWPKEKHAKNRIFQPSFIDQLARTTKGKVTTVTDDPTYRTQILTEMKNWTSSFPEPGYVTEWPEYGASFFDTLWRQKGCTIHYMQFARPAC
ncbi:MAG: tRNA (guanosine(46)-N7)-methyltransferase TrmB [Verrucomicrobia bacterium]|nr:tRNA (guanosine(46)-N7)-methyltransferase TrmB [Verrucomicrobiota bacterium]